MTILAALPSFPRNKYRKGLRRTSQQTIGLASGTVFDLPIIVISHLIAIESVIVIVCTEYEDWDFTVPVG